MATPIIDPFLSGFWLACLGLSLATTMTSRGKPKANLMDLPTEILYMIVGFAATPWDDNTPFDQNNTSAIKSLSLVNRKFREICVRSAFCRIRMWKKDDNLAGHLGDIYQHGRHLLRLSTALSIRSIGPEHDLSFQEKRDARRNPDFIQNLTLVLAEMPKLTEIRLVTDNGRQAMEPVLRQFFKPQKRTFPTVKSLYVRTTGQIADSFRCFPNLEAINFNMHKGTTDSTNRQFSQELNVLRNVWAFPRLRTLAILKTAYGGWAADNISAVLMNFSRVERLFFEGSIAADTFWDANQPHLLPALFTPHRNLRHLVITDDLYISATRRPYKRSEKLNPADPTPRWQSMASIFFSTLPNLQELCLGRQVDFQALVFHRPLGPTEKHEVIRSYSDTSGKPRLDFPPARWSGVPCRWWPADGPVPGQEEMAVPDDEVRFAGEWQRASSNRRAVMWLHYQEMLLDHCEVGFWDVEWLRVIRGMR